MIKKTFTLVALSMLMITVSCKKEEENVEKPKKEKIEFSAEERKKMAFPDSKPKVIDPNAKFASMNFAETDHDFGNITQGDKVQHVFTFTNNGDTDLIITDAKSSCGCTVPEYPKTPVKPGEKASLTVSFNSSGKKGITKKTIRIHANTKNEVETLSIVANIAEKK